MIEGAMTFPIIILSAILMLRMLVFCLEILDTGVSRHRDVMEKWDSYTGKTIRTYSEEETVSMLKGGLLGFNVNNSIETQIYLINEDFLVRTGEIFD